MNELLKIEWLKVKNYRAFIVIGIFFLIGIVGSNYMVFAIKKYFIDKKDPTKIIASVSPYNFDNVWQTTSYVSGNLLLLLSLLMIMLVTNEFSFRTHRQNIIDGWSRKQFIEVKMFMAVLFALLASLVVFFTGLGFGLTSGTTPSLRHFESIGYFFLKAVSYNMIALLMAVLVRKSGFAIGLFMVYMWLENFVSTLLEALSYKLKASYKFDWGNLGDYLPMNASDGLLHFPKNPVTDLVKDATTPADFMKVGLGAALLYLVLFFYWSNNRMLKTDL